MGTENRQVGEGQYLLLKLISRLVCLLPYCAVHAVGTLLGHGYYYLAPRQRRRAVSQISAGMGLQPADAEAVIRNLFVNLGRMFFEVMYMPALTPEKIARLVTVEHPEYLADAVAEGRGVVFLTAHVGNWEWLGASLAMAGFPMTSVIKRQPNDQHTRILNEYRQMVGIEIFARGTTELVGAARALKQGKILGFLADQDAGHNGIFIEFFGQMASSPLGPAIFARRFGAPLVPAFILRRPEGGHRVVIHPPIRFADTGDEEADVRAFTARTQAVIEATIRAHPDQWIWFQKRWNTPWQAAGAENARPGGRQNEPQRDQQREAGV